MAQDFAKRARPPSKGAADRPGAPAGRAPRLVLFGSGFLAGAFVSFLVYLAVAVPHDPQTTALPKPVPSNVSPPEIEEMQWDFYEIFPRSEVPIIEAYGEPGAKTRGQEPSPEQGFAYILQAGSFKSAQDADQLRVELILMGLDAITRKVEVGGDDWHRVVVGPFNTRLDLNRAQDKLAQAQIAAIPYRVSR